MDRASATTRLNEVEHMNQDKRSLPTISEEDLIAQVLRADDDRYRAMVSGDIPVLERLLSPALTYTHSSAHCENKEEYLASLFSGRVRYQETQRDEVSVRILGEAAILEGHVVLWATVDSVSRRLENRFLSVWSNKGDAWQLVAWASTPIPDISKMESKNVN
jgi:hypothetical protein